MSKSSPYRRADRKRPSGRRPWLYAAIGVLFAVGIYAGLRLTQPPPRPDFSALPRPAELAPATPTGEEAPPPAPATVAPESQPPPSADPAPNPDADLRVARQPPPPPTDRPRIALVIDDLGRRMDDLDTLANLGVRITYSVLPFESRTPQVVAELRRRGVEILCHLPMEPKNGAANPGPGALLLSMDHDELVAATRRALDAVPGAVGVNNHMGSGLLSQRNALDAVLSVVAENRLYFLDSRTSADTLGYSLARHLGLPAAERQVFLDTERDPAFIRGQFDELRATARKRGAAIAIAHPYRETLALLATAIPAAQAEGFEFVTVSELLDS